MAKHGTPKTMRLRKVSCQECGCTMRVSRSWIATICRGQCGCGGSFFPELPEDAAYAGLIGEQDMTGPQWTDICRLNGWEDAIRRPHGTAARYGYANILVKPARSRADHCEYAGCGSFVKHGETHCAEHARLLEPTMPF